MLRKSIRILIILIIISLFNKVNINSYKESNIEVSNNNYFMILEIPKIKLKKEIYDINSEYNDVDKNIKILPSSSMPGRGNVILASHNGNTKVSFFKRLEVLDNNDLAYIYYQGNKYEYEIYKSEIVDKTGKISINIDDSKNNLILITCKKGTNDKQIVYLARLVNSISIS